MIKGMHVSPFQGKRLSRCVATQNKKIMLPGVQVTTGLGFFLCSGCLGDSEDSDSLLLQKGLVPKKSLVPL